MALDPKAFERYRRMPNEKTTLPRLFFGVVIVALFWFGMTLAVIMIGTNGLLPGMLDDAAAAGDPVQRFLGSSGGIFASCSCIIAIAPCMATPMRSASARPSSV